MAKVTMYTKVPCGYCVAAKRYLNLAKGVTDIEEIDLSGDHAARMELASRTGMRTVPQIFIGDVHVGGYTELRAMDRAGDLDPLLAAE